MKSYTKCPNCGHLGPARSGVLFCAACATTEIDHNGNQIRRQYLMQRED